MAPYAFCVGNRLAEVTAVDNNLVENAIRPSALGKKNWLFIGHPDAGQRSAIIYSIVVSCRRHGKDPLAYLVSGHFITGQSWPLQNQPP